MLPVVIDPALVSENLRRASEAIRNLAEEIRRMALERQSFAAANREP